MHRRVRASIASGMIVLLFAGGGHATASDDATRGAAPGVSAFHSGLAAMKMGLFERARNDLERASRQLPEEPAVWADLGVLAMRQGEDAAAREHFQRAHSLAPDSADIALLAGLLERRAGNSDSAAEWFRKAAGLEPRALKPRYALATTLEERSEEQETVRELIDGLVNDDPDNLALRLKQVQLAAGAGDEKALAGAIRHLESLSDSWPEAARDQLRALQGAAGDPRQAATRATVLRNVLLRTPDFREDLGRIQVPAQTGGEAVEHFMRTPMPASKPAEPDMGLSFEPDGHAARGFLVLRAGGPGAVVEAGLESLPEDAGSAVPAVDGWLSRSRTAAVDLRNDGSLDVVVATREGLRMFRRNPDGRFVAFDAGLPSAVNGVEYRGVWAADLEMDGDMDLVLGRAEGPPLALRNNGDGSFTPRTVFEEVDGLRGFVWADMDGDGVPDAATLDAGGTVRRFRNARSWSFEPADAPGGEYIAIAAADLSWDGRIDLLTLDGDGILASWADGAAVRRGHWQSIESALKPGQADLFAADLDNNGALDVLASAADRAAIWLTGSEGRQHLLDSPLPWRVAAIRDLTGDGRLDLVGLDGDHGVVRLAGSGEHAYGWQAIRPRALENAGDNRINSLGLGGQVEIRAGLLVQRQVIDGPVVHFGLGEQDGADVAWILWPNGTSQAEFDLESRRTVDAVQRLKGSCPWVFTRDGEGMRFVTDFLWRSPLGMRVNAVDTASITQTEDRVRIPAEALAAVDGQYEIRITAELWETHFLDNVTLLAVDRPADTAMWVDERFSRGAPVLDPVFTGPPRPVTRVVDDRGRDWTDAARELDQRYVAGLDLGRYQGITRPHHVEVDLEETDRGDGLVLLASGWIYPTDSSINVAMAQGETTRPQGLRLEVPDGRGGWDVAREDMGFPAGKHKTVVIDLDDVFPPGAPRKLRLATNLEIYWDRLAVAQRRPDVERRTRRLEGGTAELRYRGFSETSQPRREMPEVPHYDRLQGTGQRWPDLAGYHTRFGDVRELLEAPDDRYVIMNAGDELVLRFDAPPPAGELERDFILVGHGWVKDGDYNTAFSRTVLPLPSRSRPEYDTPPTTLEDDPVYRQHAGDWERFHTRYISPSRFLSGLRAP